MCIIVYVPADTQRPSLNTLEECWKTNSHGAGFMYAADGQLVIKKGFMNERDFFKAWKKVPEKVAVVAHFRIRSHGDISAALTHPFIVNKQCALVHNGILNIQVPKEVEKTQSDTSYFVEAVLGELQADWYKIGAYKFLVEQYLGAGNKLVVMDAAGHVEIFSEKSGIWDEGVWYSNGGFRCYTTPKTKILYPEETNYMGYGSWENGTWRPSRTYEKPLPYTNDRLDFDATPTPPDGTIINPTRDDVSKALAAMEKRMVRPLWIDMLESVEDKILTWDQFIKSYVEGKCMAPTPNDRALPVFQEFRNRLTAFHQDRYKVKAKETAKGFRKHGRYPT